MIQLQTIIGVLLKKGALKNQGVFITLDLETMKDSLSIAYEGEKEIKTGQLSVNIEEHNVHFFIDVEYIFTVIKQESFTPIYQESQIDAVVNVLNKVGDEIVIIDKKGNKESFLLDLEMKNYISAIITRTIKGV